MKLPLLLSLALMPVSLTTLADDAKQGKLDAPAAKPDATLRVAVVNGLARRGPWPALSTAFTASAGTKVETISGQREEVTAAIRENRADIALMHKGAEADALVKNGIAKEATPWAASGFVLAGPKSDPAGVRGSKDAAEALKRILTKSSPLVGPDGQGTRAMFEQTLAKTGITVPANWKPLDPGDDAVAAAATAGAYFFAPAHRESLVAAEKKQMEVFISNDPALRLEFVAIIASKSLRADSANALIKFLSAPKSAAFYQKPAGTEGRWMDLHPLAAQPKP